MAERRSTSDTEYSAVLVVYTLEWDDFPIVLFADPPLIPTVDPGILFKGTAVSQT